MCENIEVHTKRETETLIPIGVFKKELEATGKDY